MKYVSQKELLENVISYRSAYIKDMPRSPSSNDIQLYLKQNPNCCRVEGLDFFMNSSLLDRIFGLTSIWVRIVYPLSNERLAAAPKEGEYYEAYVKLNRCGQPVRTIGMQIPESQAKGI